MDKFSNFVKILLIWKDINGASLIVSIWSKLVNSSVGGFLIFSNSGNSLLFLSPDGVFVSLDGVFVSPDGVSLFSSLNIFSF